METGFLGAGGNRLGVDVWELSVTNRPGLGYRTIPHDVSLWFRFAGQP